MVGPLALLLFLAVPADSPRGAPERDPPERDVAQEQAANEADLRGLVAGFGSVEALVAATHRPAWDIQARPPADPAFAKAHADAVAALRAWARDGQPARLASTSTLDMEPQALGRVLVLAAWVEAPRGGAATGEVLADAWAFTDRLAGSGTLLGAATAMAVRGTISAEAMKLADAGLLSDEALAALSHRLAEPPYPPRAGIVAYAVDSCLETGGDGAPLRWVEWCAEASAAYLQDPADRPAPSPPPVRGPAARRLREAVDDWRSLVDRFDREESRRAAVRVLLEVHRFKRAQGRLPTTLDELAPQLPDGIPAPALGAWRWEPDPGRLRWERYVFRTRDTEEDVWLTLDGTLDFSGKRRR